MRRIIVQQEWLSIVEYARAFDVSDMTIRRRIKNGKLRAVLKDGKYFIPLEGATASPGVHSQMQQPSTMQNQMNMQMTSPHHAGTHLNSPMMNHGVQQPFVANNPIGSPTGNFVAETHPFAEIPQVRAVQPAVIKPTVDFDHIPESISEPMMSVTTAEMNASDLLSMVDKFMEKVASTEKEVTDKFKNKIQHLEQSLKTKDVELESLRQKLEDVELLVNILENKQV
jgi:hypothetical protein